MSQRYSGYRQRGTAMPSVLTAIELPWRKVLCRSCDYFYGWMRQCYGFSCVGCGRWNSNPLGNTEPAGRGDASDEEVWIDKMFEGIDDGVPAGRGDG
jgi:hypothetical protein